MRVTLIRHGETEHNRGRLALGRADVALNERGRAQAAALADSFARPPAAIYASPLLRAMRTASAIAAVTGIAVTVEPDLIEMDIGEMEHLSGVELRERYPAFLAEWLSARCGRARMPGGETLEEVQARAWGAVQRMRERHGDDEVVAVSHNFVILAVVCAALNLPLAEFRRIRQGLASKTTLEVQDGGPTLVQLNDDAHLIAAGLADDLSGREARA